MAERLSGVLTNELLDEIATKHPKLLKPYLIDEVASGGCLDSLVSTVTFGKYGVETRRRGYLVKPVLSPGPGITTSEIVMATGMSVEVRSFPEPEISRKIVKK